MVAGLAEDFVGGIWRVGALEGGAALVAGAVEEGAGIAQ